MAISIWYVYTVELHLKILVRDYVRVSDLDTFTLL